MYIPVIVISTVSLCADYQNSMCKILLCWQASIDTLSQLVTLLVNISMIHTEYSYFNAIFISGTEIVVWYAEQILPKTSIYFVVFWSLFSTKGRRLYFVVFWRKTKYKLLWSIRSCQATNQSTDVSKFEEQQRAIHIVFTNIHNIFCVFAPLSIQFINPIEKTIP